MRILLFILAISAVGAAAFVRLGFYDISATDQHLAPTYWLLDTAMKYSVKRRGKDIKVPELGGKDQIEKGLALYRAQCENCHGGPGVAPEIERMSQPRGEALEHGELRTDRRVVHLLDALAIGFDRAYVVRTHVIVFVRTAVVTVGLDYNHLIAGNKGGDVIAPIIFTLVEIPVRIAAAKIPL